MYPAPPMTRTTTAFSFLPQPPAAQRPAESTATIRSDVRSPSWSLEAFQSRRGADQHCTHNENDRSLYCDAIALVSIKPLGFHLDFERTVDTIQSGYGMWIPMINRLALWVC